MLHQLPTELHHHILSYLPVSEPETTTQTLIALALTHHTLTGPATEQLLLNASVPLHGIPLYLVRILRSPLAHKIKSIHLHASEIDESAPARRMPYDVEAIQVARRLVQCVFSADEREHFEFALAIYHGEPVLWTALLFAALPGVNTLEISVTPIVRITQAATPWSAAQNATRASPPTTAHPFDFILHHQPTTPQHPHPRHQPSGILDKIESALAARLSTLHLPTPPAHLTLSHLPSLTHLTLHTPTPRSTPSTFNDIFNFPSNPDDPENDNTHPTPTLPPLPPSLTTLHLHTTLTNTPWRSLRALQSLQITTRFGSNNTNTNTNTNTAPARADLHVRLFMHAPSRLLAQIVFFNPGWGGFRGVDVGGLLVTWEVVGVGFEMWFLEEEEEEEEEDEGEGGGGVRLLGWRERSFVRAVDAVREGAGVERLPWMGGGGGGWG